MPNDTARQENGHTRPKRFYGNPLPEENSDFRFLKKRETACDSPEKKKQRITVIPVRGNISASRAFREPFIIFTLLAILSHEGELHKNPLLHSDVSYALFFAL